MIRETRPHADAAKAHTEIEARKTMGSTILLI
jgi:hypothetical protein